ncbi:hypothetical protein [Streptomyces sp. NPDC046862]|uniref:hypothetical protein n=1 Tax=Streptomyces sp. NPDC046862 TaxID=3154603 RepID=UPI0034562625
MVEATACGEAGGVTYSAPFVEYDMDSYTAPGTARNARRIVNTGDTFVTYGHYASYYIGQL